MKNSSLLYLMVTFLLVISGCNSGGYDEDGGDYMSYSPAYYTYGPGYYGYGYYGYGDYYDNDYIVTPPRDSERLRERLGEREGSRLRPEQPIARPGLGQRGSRVSQRPMRSMPSIPSRPRGGGGGMRRR
jgi:hypothetical protein